MPFVVLCDLGFEQGHYIFQFVVESSFTLCFDRHLTQRTFFFESQNVVVDALLAEEMEAMLYYNWISNIVEADNAFEL